MRAFQTSSRWGWRRRNSALAASGVRSMGNGGCGITVGFRRSLAWAASLLQPASRRGSRGGGAAGGGAPEGGALLVEVDREAERLGAPPPLALEVEAQRPQEGVVRGELQQ